jgi:hypothetical protein
MLVDPANPAVLVVLVVISVIINPVRVYTAALAVLVFGWALDVTVALLIGSATVLDDTVILVLVDPAFLAVVCVRLVLMALDLAMAVLINSGTVFALLHPHLILLIYV